MFNKESLQSDITDILLEIYNLKCSGEVLHDEKNRDDIWTALENIVDESAKLMNLADALLARVKAMK